MSERVSLGHFIHIHVLSIGKRVGSSKYELYILYITSYISGKYSRTNLGVFECHEVEKGMLSLGPAV